SRLRSGQRWTAYSSWTSRVRFAQRQIQLFAWSRRPIFFSASACRTTFTPSRLSSRGQPSTQCSAAPLVVARPAFDEVQRAVERLGVLGRRDLLQRAQPQLRVLVALDGGQ